MASIRYAFQPGTTYGQARLAYEEIDSIEGIEPPKDLAFPPGMENELLPAGQVDTVWISSSEPETIVEQLKHIQWIDPTSVQAA